MLQEAPEKIYVVIDPIWGSMSVNYNCHDGDNIEYIRKDIVDSMLATAEDHAYFAGSERAKEKLADAFIEKTVEWLNNFYNEDTHSYLIDEDIEKFINYMKGE